MIEQLMENVSKTFRLNKIIGIKEIFLDSIPNCSILKFLIQFNLHPLKNYKKSPIKNIHIKLFRYKSVPNCPISELK